MERGRFLFVSFQVRSEPSMTSRIIKAVLPGNGRTADNKTSKIRYAEQTQTGDQ